MKKTLLFIFLALSSQLSAQILFADYSDPDVCQGPEGDYWLTASSFQETPGLPILHSKDLQNWECVNFAIHKLIPEEVYNKVQHGKGVWAPSIRYHEGEYYIYWGDPDFGIFMVHAKDPRGTWSEPVWVMKAKGIIDTTPLWDEDGRCYLVNGWAGSRCGFNSVITIRELSADGTKVIGEPKMVYDGLTEGNHTIEGPKLYKQNGYYYILAPAGGVEKGWQVALRSKNIYGPYESKIVFNKDGIHQGGWVSFGNSETQKLRNSETQGAFICFQDRGVYGRILYLLDVKMKDGWPMMSQIKNEKLKIKNYSAHEGYAWHSNYQDFYGFHGFDRLTNQSFTRVYGEYHDTPVNFWEVNNLYLKKFEGESFCDTLSTTISAKANGQQAGFIIMGRSYCRIAVELQGSKGSKFVIKQIVNNNADGLSPQQGSAALDSNKKGNETAEGTKVIGEVKAEKIAAGANPVYQAKINFRIECKKGGMCEISYNADANVNADSKWTKCTPFQARQGKWIGAKYGVYAITLPGVERNYIDLRH